MDARLTDSRRAQAPGGLVEGHAVREKAHVREEPLRAQRGDTARVRGGEAEIVGVEDDARQGVSRRRRSARISGAKRAISRRIVRTVRGEERVERPRVRGK